MLYRTFEAHDLRGGQTEGLEEKIDIFSSLWAR